MTLMDRRTVLELMLTGMAVRVSAASGDPSMAARSPVSQASGRRARVLVFDVNETLLNVNALAPQFTRVFGNASVLQEWFSTVLLYSQTITITGPYADFGSVAAASLDMTAASHGVPLPQADRQQILTGLRTLPPHPDVRDGLVQLRDAGFRLVTLTNSPPAVVQQQLENAELAGFFERRFSVDTVRRFKPATEVYKLVATELGVPPAQLRLIAAHAWDVLGAMRAGCTAAFIARPGKTLYPLVDKPDVIGADLREVAQQIIRIDTTR
jgi:2-haloacid dehalogenase